MLFKTCGLFKRVSLYIVFSAISTPIYAVKSATENQVSFTNTSESIMFQHKADDGISGIAWLDYDADDDLDLLITNSTGFNNGLFRNDGDNKFTDVTISSGLASIDGNSAVVSGDIDNDGFVDIFMSGSGYIMGPAQSPTKIYHNNGNGTFTDISSTANVPGAETAVSASMADINNDGFLDLFITSPGHLGVLFPPAAQHTDRLYLNNGDLTFTDISQSSGVTGSLGSCASAFSDYDNDGWMDLYVGVCNDVNLIRTPFHLFRNNQDNTFTDVASTAGINKPGFWMSVAMADIDNDGDIDLFSTNSATPSPDGNATHVIFSNNGNGTYSELDIPEITNSEFGWGATFADFDNDGFVDLFFAGSLPPFNIIGPGLGNPGRLFFNDRKGGFIQNNSAHGLDLSSEYATGIAQADFDGNGFPDLAIATSEYILTNPVSGLPETHGTGKPVLLQNNTNNNNWLTINLQGTKSNKMAIGARIDMYTHGFKYNHQIREIRAGSSFASSETPWPTFGMGKSKSATLKISWPSGLVEWFPFVRSGKKVTFTEGTGLYKTKRR